MSNLSWGSFDTPIALSTAFYPYAYIQPGHTVYLRAGTYSGTWANKLQGTAENPIIIKPYNNERVIISGDFRDLSAQYITYIDIEFTTTRNPGAAWTDTPSHYLAGVGCKYINCTFHDSNGAGFWDNADLFYGCISYNHGIIYSGDGHGHSLYTQNQDAGHNKVVKHSVFGRSANYGLHGYATDFNITNLDIIENVLLPGSVHLIGSLNADDGILFQGNHTFGIVQLGYWDHDNASVTITGNRMYNRTGNPFALNMYLGGTVTGNTFVSGEIGGADMDVLRYQPPDGVSTLAINNNAYFSRSGKASCIATDGIPPYWMTLATWQSLYGFDAGSTMTLGESPADSVHVYPNEYAGVSKRKGLVVIHNWSEAASVDVDLSDIEIDAGQTYTLRQAQDPLNDVRSGTMPANKIVSVTMSGTIASVSGWTDPASTFPEFGAFIVEGMA